MTPDQKSTIASILSVDLATLDSDRLIELCVIYRAAPDALDTFPAALNAELVRRYSSEAIASEDVNFAVLQHMANQFQRHPLFPPAFAGNGGNGEPRHLVYRP